MKKVGLILQFHRATKENCLTLHLASLQNHHVFQLRSPRLCKILCILLVEYVEPGKNRSDVPSSRNAVDITNEQTINRHAKSHSRIVGFSRYRSAYYRWWRLDMQEQAICKQPKKRQNLKNINSQIKPKLH